MVRAEHDLDAGALYLRLAEGDVARTVAVDDGCNVDLDADGRLLGIEVIGPGRPWPLPEIMAAHEISDGDRLMLAALYPNGVTVSAA